MVATTTSSAKPGSTGKTSSPTSTSQAPTYIFETPALTTTFTPAPTCTDHHLTMLESDSYKIWLNEPRPVANSTFSDCYPSEYMTSYLESASNTIAPAFSPLVCPGNYQTAFQSSMSDRPLYVACCPSDFLLAPPSSAVEGRPAYGGTCYSNITSVMVTAYDNSSSTGQILFTTPGLAQAYAHPIDGFISGAAATSSAASSSTPSSHRIAEASSASASIASATPAAATLAAMPSSNTRISGGAVGGIVAAIIVVLILVLAGMFFFWRRRRAQAAQMNGAGPYMGPRGQPMTAPAGYMYGSGSPKHMQDQQQRRQQHTTPIFTELPAYTASQTDLRATQKSPSAWADRQPSGRDRVWDGTSH